MTRIPIVDKKDRIVGYKERAEVGTNEIVQTSALWVENSRGEVLISKRGLHVKAYSGIWGTAATGTVDEGETYETNMVKEAGEEIGLTNFEYKIGPKFYLEEPTRHKFCQYFIAKVDQGIDKFKVSPEEVAEIKWVKKDWLINDIKACPEKYTPSLTEMTKNLAL